MRITVIDHVHDEQETYQVTSLSKEKGAFRIGTPQLIFLIDSFEELAESAVDLIDRPSLPEPRRPERVRSLQSLEDVLASLSERHQ